MSLKLASLFHGVKQNPTTQNKIAFWQQCRSHAKDDPVALTKLAFELWAQHHPLESLPQEKRAAIAAAFGSNIIVEKGLAQLQKTGQLNTNACTQIQNWVAECAFDEINDLTSKVATTLDATPSRITPNVILGVLGGAALGQGARTLANSVTRKEPAQPINPATKARLFGALGGAALGTFTPLGMPVGAVAGALLGDHFHKTKQQAAQQQQSIDALTAALHQKSLAENPPEKTGATLRIDRLPMLVNALGGAAVGGGLGAWIDKDQPGRGALLGATTGGTLGALKGHMLQTALHMDGHPQLEKILNQVTGTKTGAVFNFPGAVLGAADLGVPMAVLGAGYGALTKDPERPYENRLDRALSSGAKAGLIGAGLGAVGGGVTPEGIEKAWNAIRQTATKIKEVHQNPKYTQGILRQGLKTAQDPMAQDLGAQDPSVQDPNAMVPDPTAQDAQTQGPAESLEPAAVDPLPEAIEGLQKAEKTIENLSFLATQLNMPQLAQDIEAQRDALIEHFSAGHSYLPTSLQHHFPQSEQAETFMKKYKQRFGNVSGGKTKTSTYRF